jgi:hypothetical protein
MKVGDLVRYIVGYPHLGLVVDFDKDGDPIVEFFDQDMVSAAYYTADIEVINEG